MNFCKRWIRCMLNSNQDVAAKGAYVTGFLHFIEEMLPHLQRYYKFRGNLFILQCFSFYSRLLILLSSSFSHFFLRHFPRFS